MSICSVICADHGRNILSEADQEAAITEAEIEQQKREWELGRLQALKEEEERAGNESLMISDLSLVRQNVSPIPDLSLQIDSRGLDISSDALASGSNDSDTERLKQNTTELSWRCQYVLSSVLTMEGISSWKLIKKLPSQRQRSSNKSKNGNSAGSSHLRKKSGAYALLKMKKNHHSHFHMRLLITRSTTLPLTHQSSEAVAYCHLKEWLFLYVLPVNLSTIPFQHLCMLHSD